MIEYQVEILRNEPREWVQIDMQYDWREAIQFALTLCMRANVLAARVITQTGNEVLHVPPNDQRPSQGDINEMMRLASKVESMVEQYADKHEEIYQDCTWMMRALRARFESGSN